MRFKQAASAQVAGTRTAPSRRSFVKGASMTALAGGLVPALAACNSEDASGASGSGKQIRVLSTSYGNVIPWTSQGMLAQKFWGEHFNAKVTQLDPGNDPSKQLNQLEDALSQKWDVAVINSIVQGGLSVPVQKLIDAGTVVVGYLSDVALEEKPLEGLLTTVQADNYQIGFDSTTALCNAIGGRGTFIETQGVSGGSNVIGRHNGCADALKAFPDVELLTSDYGNFVPDKAQTLWESYVTKYPQIDAAFCHNEDMALAACNALKAAGRENDTLLAGVDGTAIGCQAVLDGELFLTVRHAASQVYSWPLIIGASKFRKTLEGDVPTSVAVPSPVVDKEHAASIVFTQSPSLNLQ
jgi:ribose transport system substrate-binding protein